MPPHLPVLPFASFAYPISASTLLVHPPWEKELPKVGLHQLPG